MSRTRLHVLLASALVAALVAVTAPGPAARPATATATASAVGEVYEVHYVPTVGDAVIRVEVWRDPAYDAGKQPVILTYSPYNSLSEPEPARDAVGETYVPEGYARAVADVLGTRGSTGCWDYGGRAEQQSGVDVVKWLARRDWSNGRVAMIGGSYNGTTASMVAARGDDVPELKAIVPIAAISRWYGYAYGNGVRYLLNSEVPSDEGFDTPLAFDLGFGKTVAADPMGQHFADTMRDAGRRVRRRRAHRGGLQPQPRLRRVLARARLPPPRRRLPGRGAARARLAGLQREAGGGHRALAPDPRRPAAHRAGRGRALQADVPRPGLARRRDRRQAVGRPALTLPGADAQGSRTGIRGEGPVLTQGETSTGVTGFRTLGDYPAPGLDPTTLWLRDGTTLAGSPAADRHVSSYVETGTSTEEATPGTTYVSRPARHATRLVGSPVLRAQVRVSGATMHLTPVLYDEAPDGSRSVVARGFQHVDYRDGLRSADPDPGSWLRVAVRLLPVDYTLAEGHRFALAVQSSNTVWAVPGNPGTVDVADGPVRKGLRGSRLVLPTL